MSELTMPPELQSDPSSDTKAFPILDASNRIVGHLASHLAALIPMDEAHRAEVRPAGRESRSIPHSGRVLGRTRTTFSRTATASKLT